MDLIGGDETKTDSCLVLKEIKQFRELYIYFETERLLIIDSRMFFLFSNKLEPKFKATGSFQ